MFNRGACYGERGCFVYDTRFEEWKRNEVEERKWRETKCRKEFEGYGINGKRAKQRKQGESSILAANIKINRIPGLHNV